MDVAFNPTTTPTSLVSIIQPSHSNFTSQFISFLTSNIWAFSPFGYKLTTTDIHGIPSLANPGVVQGYVVNDRIAQTLWHTLQTMGRAILDAALPLPDCEIISSEEIFTRIIPTYMFDSLGLPRPTVLDTLNLHVNNPLFFICTTQEEAIARFESLQALLIESMYNSLFSFYHLSHVSLKWLSGWLKPRPDALKPLTLTNGPGIFKPSTIPILSPIFKWISSVIHSPAPLTNNVECRDIILHPTASTYAHFHPGYNPWDGHTLHDNGYMGDVVMTSVPLAANWDSISPVTVMMKTLRSTFSVTISSGLVNRGGYVMDIQLS
ncbi:hypothetical protein BDQ17DRAFT_1435671 [Cyathus striatus]|nr:hypothetical protein BDQ17DRAFT_1435671 [Cyathus striatus]